MASRAAAATPRSAACSKHSTHTHAYSLDHTWEFPFSLQPTVVSYSDFSRPAKGAGMAIARLL